MVRILLCTFNIWSFEIAKCVFRCCSAFRRIVCFSIIFVRLAKTASKFDKALTKRIGDQAGTENWDHSHSGGTQENKPSSKVYGGKKKDNSIVFPKRLWRILRLTRKVQPRQRTFPSKWQGGMDTFTPRIIQSQWNSFETVHVGRQPRGEELEASWGWRRISKADFKTWKIKTASVKFSREQFPPQAQNNIQLQRSPSPSPLDPDGKFHEGMDYTCQVQRCFTNTWYTAC